MTQGLGENKIITISTYTPHEQGNSAMSGHIAGPLTAQASEYYKLVLGTSILYREDF